MSVLDREYFGQSLSGLASARAVDCGTGVRDSDSIRYSRDDRSPRVLQISEAQRRDGSLALVVLGGSRCALPPQSSLWESAAPSLLWFDTSVVSLKRLCFTALSANTWRPFSSKPKIGIPAASFLVSSVLSLSTTCDADSSATASPVFAVRLATMSCWWLFPARKGVSVHPALGDGWPTLRHIFGTMFFPPFRFGSGSCRCSSAFCSRGGPS